MATNISYDFDGCLSRQDIQLQCKFDIEQGCNVRITTSRWETPNNGNNNDLLEVANKLGIKIIIYTSHQHKYKFMEGVDIHYDDDSSCVDNINKFTATKGVLV